MKKTSITLFLVIILSLPLTFTYSTAKALPYDSAVIRIKSDGTIEGTNSIQRDGNVYTLTGDINSSVGSDEAFFFVEKDNIVIDGAGYTLQGTGGGTGILMLGRRNVAIQNLNIKGFGIGITFWAVMNFPADSKFWGLGHATNNRILNNSITTTPDAPLSSTGSNVGIDLREADGTLISGNTITSPSKTGISITWNYQGTTLLNNKFIGCGLYLTASNQTTAVGNTVDGEPLVFLDGASNQVIDSAGQVLLYNCTGITVKNVQPTANYGNTIQLSDTSDSEVTCCEGDVFLKNSASNRIHDNFPHSIELSGSTYNKIFANTITDSGVCLKLYAASDHNDVYSNTFLNSSTSTEAASLLYSGKNPVGISLGNVGLGGCQYNNIYRNSLVNHGVGIESYSSPNNAIYANDIRNCSVGISLGGSNLNNISQNNITACNVGISIHSASSNSIFYHNNFVNNRRDASETHDTLFSPILYDYSVNNTWDNGYPSGGNYWSSYNGTDANQDGIGDTPYIVYENYTDHYPLMNLFETEESPPPSLLPLPSSSPTPTPPLTAAPSPSSSQSSPHTESSSPSEHATASPEPKSTSLTVEAVCAVAAVVVVAVIVSVALVFRRRRSRSCCSSRSCLRSLSAEETQACALGDYCFFRENSFGCSPRLFFSENKVFFKQS